MKVSIGCDHGGFSLKEVLKEHLKALGHDVTDCGAYSDAPSDYPDFAKTVAGDVSKGESERGVLVCGSGIGMCMSANRFFGVRAAVIRDETDARLCRSHNDANVACFGGRITEPSAAVRLLDIFMDTPFEGGRHVPRIEKIDEIGGRS